MEFSDGDGAMFRRHHGRSIYTSDSAERLLRTQSILGDVQLKWL